jgi:hypothetical protein
MMRLLRAEHDGRRARGLKYCDDFFPPGFGQVMRKKAAIAYDNSECHLALRCHVVAPLNLPQGLKPHRFIVRLGTTEVVP